MSVPLAHEDDGPPRYGRVREGICPFGRPLERREGWTIRAAPVGTEPEDEAAWSTIGAEGDFGYCPDCGCGWRAEEDGGIALVLVPHGQVVFRDD